jgi:hypothetical protein
MNKKLIGVILVILALFLGIVPHDQYCNALSKIHIDNCPTAMVAGVSAVVVFAIAVYMCQYDEFTNMMT